MWLSSQPYATVDECAEDCNRPGSLLWKHEECVGLAEANLECLVALSCTEYLAHHENLDESACHDSTYEFSVCLAINTPPE